MRSIIAAITLRYHRPAARIGVYLLIAFFLGIAALYPLFIGMNASMAAAYGMLIIMLFFSIRVILRYHVCCQRCSWTGALRDLQYFGGTCPRCHQARFMVPELLNLERSMRIPGHLETNYSYRVLKNKSFEDLATLHREGAIWFSPFDFGWWKAPFQIELENRVNALAPDSYLCGICFSPLLSGENRCPTCGSVV